MRRNLMRLSMLAAVAAACAWLAAPGSAQEPTEPGQPTLISAPAPTAGEVLATGLLSPRGMKMGPDGLLYVAEAGTGGDTVINVDGADHNIGNTGRISTIDPESGERTTVVDDLPSDFSTATMDSLGPADVAFIGDQLYYLQTHGGEDYGAPDTPTGIYRVNDDGSTELVADIGAFNFANPVEDISSGAQADIEPGGNPYAMDVRDGDFLVVDGNQNQVMRVTTDGDVSRVAELDGHPVSTGIAFQSGGPLYVGALGTFPFSPEDGKVFQVGYPSGAVSDYAGGFSSVTDVEFGPGGLYAVTFGDQASSPDGPPWDFYSGKILKVNSDGTMTPVVDGLTFSTFLVFDGDTAYVANHSLSVPGAFEGQIWKIEGFSTLEPLAPPPAPAPTQAPPAPAPTATPATGGIVAPDTGSGGDAGSSDFTMWMIVIMLAAGVAGVAVIRMAAKR